MVYTHNKVHSRTRMHSLTYASIHSLTHLLTLLLTHSLTCIVPLLPRPRKLTMIIPMTKSRGQ